MLSKEKVDRLFKTAEKAFAGQGNIAGRLISEESSKALTELKVEAGKAFQSAQEAIDAGRDLIEKSHFR